MSISSAGDPTVSIILATNRSSRFFAETLACVSAQVFAGWELLIIDNGVPDPESVISATRGIPNTRIYRVEGPCTVSTARNVGVSHSRAPFITFLDDDDVWSKDRLALQVESLEDHADAPCSLVGYWYLDGEGAQIGEGKDAQAGSAEEMLSGRLPYLYVSAAMMVRREEFLLVGGFSSEMAMLEDFDLTLRLLLRGNFVSVPGHHFGYRRHDGNVVKFSPEGNRLRRKVMEGILIRHADAAAVRGDTAAELLLSEHLDRFRSYQATQCAPALVHQLRAAKIAEAAREGWWGFSRSPVAMGRSLAKGSLTQLKFRSRSA